MQPTTSYYTKLKEYLQTNNYSQNDQRLILNYIDPTDYEPIIGTLAIEASELLSDALACDQDVIDEMLSKEPA